MDPQWKTVVLPRLSALVDSWAPDIEEIYAAHLVDNSERDLLLDLPRREQCVSLLLKILPWKGVGTYERFYRVLPRREKRKFPFGVREGSAKKRAEEPIDHRWRSLVNWHLPQLVRLWDLHLDHLYVLRILDEEELKLLRTLSPDARCHKLLVDILPQKVPTELNAFLKMEGQINAHDIVNMLKKLEERVEGLVDLQREFLDHRWELIVGWHFDDLVRLWDLDLDRLRACHLLGEEEHNLLRALPVNEQCQKLLNDILPRKLPRALNTFLEMEGRIFADDVVKMLEELGEKQRYFYRLWKKIQYNLLLTRGKPVDPQWLIPEQFLSQLLASWKLSKPTFDSLHESGLISTKEYDRFVSLLSYVEELETKAVFSEDYLLAESQEYGRRKLLTEFLLNMSGDSFHQVLMRQTVRGILPVKVQAILDSVATETAFYVPSASKATTPAPAAKVLIRGSSTHVIILAT